MTPKQILAQIPILATQPFLSISQLEGGHSNQSFLISTPEVKYVLRLDAEAQAIFQCDRHFELEVLNLLSSKGLSPTPAFTDFNNGVLLYTFLEGNPLTRELLVDEAIKQKLIQLRGTISNLGKRITSPFPSQSINSEETLTSQLPRFDKLSKIQHSLRPLRNQLARFSNEFCLCHNDLTPSNLLQTEEGNLFALDWEYAAINHPLLDFAFIANSFQLDDAYVQQNYSESISHSEVDFSEIRQLGWFIEALWYAKRQLHNPSERWSNLLENALSKL